MKCAVLVFAFLGVIALIQGFPHGNHHASVNCILNQMDDCDLNSGPVCAIDASGITETFENKCMAFVVSCHRDTFFVEVKPGEC
ncbi:hypothetical protein ABEB36_014206 [Hypothenemus hampei]|uniref:Kazal-like domain-containing protein n=1 Tax=Hypothenemus hampei TaxID=57062 RepID=A0ABD1E3N0_HYPHA